VPNTETGGAVELFQAGPGTLWSGLTQLSGNLSLPLLFPSLFFSSPTMGGNTSVPPHHTGASCGGPWSGCVRREKERKGREMCES